MELNDAVRRILLQHWRLILVLTALGVGLAAVFHVGEPETYTASSRLVLDTPDPESRAESTAIADTAKAIATSPAQVTEAVRKAGVSPRREVVVSVRALGSSGVLELSVTDQDPRAAAAIANSLATALIETRRGVTEGEVEQVLRDLDQRISELNARIARADAEIESLNAEAAAAATASEMNAVRNRRNEVSRLRDFLAQQRSVLETQRVELLSTDALRPKPSVISLATPPTHADPAGWLPDLVLGALLGLVLGIGLAGLIETFRPKFVGGDALAAEFDTPHLGDLPGGPQDERSLEELPRIAARLRIVAEAAGFRNVDLLPVGPRVDLRPLAERLEFVTAATALDRGPAREAATRIRGESAAAALPEEEAPEPHVAGRIRPALHIRPFDVQFTSVNNGGGSGLVLVAPAALEKRDLVDTRRLLRVVPLPVLGLITYAPSRSKRRWWASVWKGKDVRREP